MKSKLIIIAAVAFSPFLSCKKSNDPPRPENPDHISSEQFSDYWYSGKAEIVSYNLKQSRYGEIHDGKAVLIFVTEPFSMSKQVKLDYPERNTGDKVTVMKMNFVKKFNTGIYPYSLMLSAFTPVDRQQNPHTLKVSMSAQEWCGHVYSQMNLDDEKYEISSFSYLEQEGDRQFNLDATLLEDELWNMIRLNYKSLPVGKFNIIPGLFYSRLMHQELKAVEASASLKERKEEATYLIDFPERALSITFRTSFPYTITSWEEIYQGLGGKQSKTSARYDRKLHIDYWTKNKNAFDYLRDSLNLDD